MLPNDVCFVGATNVFVARSGDEWVMVLSQWSLIKLMREGAHMSNGVAVHVRSVWFGCASMS
eukprot:14209402-Alexandrium_andersonii.AAC.1